MKKYEIRNDEKNERLVQFVPLNCASVEELYNDIGVFTFLCECKIKGYTEKYVSLERFCVTIAEANLASNNWHKVG